MDFHGLNAIVRPIVAELDHKTINVAMNLKDWELVHGKISIPITAESLVMWFAWKIAHAFESYDHHFNSVTCRLQEGPGGWAQHTVWS